jgi:ribokinase
MDLTSKTATMPSAGETVIGSSFTMVPGGTADNQAVTCARQGVATAMVGRVGTDAFGDAIRAQLVAEGLTPHISREPNGATGIAHITVDSAVKGLKIQAFPISPARQRTQGVGGQ